MRIVLRKFPYSYLPYEKRLSRQEAMSFGAVVCEDEQSIELHARRPQRQRVSAGLTRLTYFSHFCVDNGSFVPTQQFLLETTANGSKTAARQSTRYSTHGLHEYKGKFHPQIARFLLTQANLKRDDVVLDPFAGSGTVLVEAVHFGCNAVGVEINPLAALVANAKLKLLTCANAELAHFVRGIDKAAKTMTASRCWEAMAADLGLTDNALAYLRSWFAPRILAQLLAFRIACRRTLGADWSWVADAITSSVVRDISHQEPADLRIRRRKTELTDAPVVEQVRLCITTLMSRTVAARKLVNHVPAIAEELVGDCRTLSSELSARLERIGRRRVNAIITSPPYATALPYIDTSRLSLVLLGLCKPSELRDLERLVIGNREITNSERKAAESGIEEQLQALPAEIGRFTMKLLGALRTTEAGFRKWNMPALLAQYFCDMKQVLIETRGCLSGAGKSYWLVGPNKTNSCGKWLMIDTPAWIAATAEMVGYSASISTLDAYQRFGLHQRNGIRQEFLITLSPN